ncbi:hypothetical protein F5148DRAFT_1242676 [Russula earlei]|uniref:Uncharacterized protein n=1 Tax=Russula earlei TaxID=71964 RepID=A0ACC0TV96_9AGAM|nr:hypothetical protein F5148DRAFT_1242676 [Russula earlei]
MHDYCIGAFAGPHPHDMMKSHKSSPNNLNSAAITGFPRPFFLPVTVKTIMHRAFLRRRRTSTQPVEVTEDLPAHHHVEVSQAGRNVSIEILPDEVLLEIFDHDRLIALSHPSLGPWKWQRLVHVCRSWRSLIFASPRRLCLRLYYTYRKPVTQNMGKALVPQDDDNVIAALMHHDRICEINFAMTSHLLERSTILMQEPFPVLEHLLLRSRNFARTALVLPSSFLGGSAPRLQDIHLDGIAFPALPQLLLSTQNLGSLQLEEIPGIEFFSPETLVNSMSSLTQLKSLKMHFASPTSHPNQSNSRPPSISSGYTVLPALTEFRFRGSSEFFEDLVSRLETPSLQQFCVGFFDQPAFKITELSLFIGRTRGLTSPRKASIQIWMGDIAIIQHFKSSPYRLDIRLQISRRELGRRVASMSQICRQLFPFLSHVERLDVKAFLLFSARRQRDQLDPAQWLELFRPFEGVKVLEVTGTLVGNIAFALEHATGEMTRDVFPALSDLHLNRPRGALSTSIESFVSARQLSGRPMSAHYRGEKSFDYWGEHNQESMNG